MKKILILLVISSTAFSQTKTQREISIEKNFDWIQKFDKYLAQTDKLFLITEKVKQDSVINYNPTITYISKNGHLHDSIDSSKPCKILFVLNQRKKMWLIDLNQFPKYSKILKYITVDRIEKIDILNENGSKAVFGNRGECGVIMIKSNDRKLKRMFKRASNQ